MMDSPGSEPTRCSTASAIAADWSWFIALGVGELMLGVVASTNVLAASSAPLLVTGAAISVAGLFQIVHAVSARGLDGMPLWLFAGMAYATTGAVIFYDPIITSATSTLATAGPLIVAGFLRLCSGLYSRPATGSGWISATAVLSVCAGLVLIDSRDRIEGWWFGAILVVDLIFQASGLIAFGITLRSRRLTAF